MAFLRAQAKENRCRVEGQVNSIEKGENADNSEWNGLRQHVSCAQNCKKRYELHDDWQNECSANFLRNDLVATVHGVHAKWSPACQCDVQCDGGQKNDGPDNCCDIKHNLKIKKRTPSGKGGNLKESESVWVL